MIQYVCVYIQIGVGPAITSHLLYVCMYVCVASFLVQNRRDMIRMECVHMEYGACQAWCTWEEIIPFGTLPHYLAAKIK